MSKDERAQTGEDRYHVIVDKYEELLHSAGEDPLGEKVDGLGPIAQWYGWQLYRLYLFVSDYPDREEIYNLEVLRGAADPIKTLSLRSGIRHEDVKSVFDDLFGSQGPAEFGFGGALSFLKEGERVARQGWNGKGMWVELRHPSEHSEMTQPYIYMKTVSGDLIPWLASQADVLAEDWVLVD